MTNAQAALLAAATHYSGYDNGSVIGDVEDLAQRWTQWLDERTTWPPLRRVNLDDLVDDLPDNHPLSR